MESKRLSAHFNLREFHCKDGTEVPESHEKALKDICEKILEPMRRRFGPCTVHSGFRTDSHNRKVGGARNSFHRYGVHANREVACDVSFRKGNVSQWKTEARRLLSKEYGNSRGGIGFYPRGGFVHIDTRLTGPVSWDGP